MAVAVTIAICGVARAATFVSLSLSASHHAEGRLNAVGIRRSKTPPASNLAPACHIARSAPKLKRAAPSSVALLVGLGTVGVASALWQRRRDATTARRAEQSSPEPGPEEWNARVRRIEGERAVFEVTIPKPLGLVPADFPNRPGVGVAKITPGGNTDNANRRVLVDNEPGMFVLEGDEVVAVNGQNVEGQSLDIVGPMVKDSAGDSVTLTLCRAYYAGPVKVVFLPSGKFATMKRGVEILKAADVGVQEVSFSCKEGWCKACWHTDTMWGIVYRACSASSPKKPPPKNPRTIPEKWDNVMPLCLLNWPETLKRERAKKEREKQQKAMSS